MRVMMLGWEFPPHISGGLGTACLGLTRALERLYVVTERHNLSAFLKGLPDSPLEAGPHQSAWMDDLADPCSSCGAEMEPDWRFCPVCFHGLPDSSGKPARP